MLLCRIKIRLGKFTMPSNNAQTIHFPLKTDANDTSQFGLRGDPRGVIFRDGAAWFDGRGAHIEVPGHEALRFADKSFSISAHIYTDRVLDSALGDLVCKFDPATSDCCTTRA